MQPPSLVTDPGLSGRLSAAVATGSGPGVTMAALRARGAHRFDPIRFRLIEALARRAAGHEGRVRQLLDGKLASLLAAYCERFEEARAEAGDTLDRVVAKNPQAADPLRQLHVGGDFRALHRLAAELDTPGPAGPLAELVRHIERQSSVLGDERSADQVVAAGGPPAELKAVRYFRSSWSRLSVDQQLTRSRARVPENAGPLNSQRLVLRSLQLMRDVSPAYLSRFMSYVDALLWLDQANLAGAPVQASASRGEGGQKRKPGRGRSG